MMEIVAYEIYGYCEKNSNKHFVYADFKTIDEAQAFLDGNSICAKHDSPWVEVKPAGKGASYSVKIW